MHVQFQVGQVLLWLARALFVAAAAARLGYEGGREHERSGSGFK